MAHYTNKDLNTSANTSIPDEVDIAVVGGGVSGLYSTWKILEKDASQRICILEQLNRTGGRLDSDLIKFKEQDGSIKEVKEEQGGMRFTFDTMDNLMALFLQLNLTNDIVPFPMNSGGNNRLYFRGHAFTNAEAKEDNYSVWSDLYNLSPQEQGIDPKSIINTVFNRILDVNPQFTERPLHRDPDFWQRFRLQCQWNGVSLVDWQLQGLLSDMGYSVECINLLYRLSGFNGTFLSGMNAGVAYQLLEDFPADPKFKTLKNGFSTLTNAMVTKIDSIKSGGEEVERIFLRTMVDGIDKKGEVFTINYTRIVNGKTVKGEVKAKKIILGLPRLALEKMFIGSSLFSKLDTATSEKIWNTLQSASNQPLLKINLYYDKAWWGNKISGQPPIEFGPNFSDTPLGSVYPFYTVDEEIATALEYSKWLKDNGQDVPADIQAILDKKYNLPAALTIYCDYMNINFWKALQNQGKPYHTEMQAKNPKLLAASEVVVEQATAFFKKLFNTHYVPKPSLTSARVWSGSSYFPQEDGTSSGDENTTYQPYGYGVHQWAMGAQDDQVMSDLVQPIEGVELYTCGEAFSDYQGWVEGALRSTNLVLEQKFGIKGAAEAYEASTGTPPNDAIKGKYWNRYRQLIISEFSNVGDDFRNARNPYLDQNTAERSVLENGELDGAAPTNGQANEKKKGQGFGVELTYFDQH